MRHKFSVGSLPVAVGAHESRTLSLCAAVSVLLRQSHATDGLVPAIQSGAASSQWQVSRRGRTVTRTVGSDIALRQTFE
jgi:hypothetical protein